MQDHSAAVVFDLDGTLTETEPIWEQVRKQLAAQDGVPWPDDATAAMIGMSTQEWSAYLSDVVGLHGDAADARRRTLDGMVAAYRDHLPVLPGAIESLRRLHERWPLGLATSSSPILVETSIEIMGVADLFSAVVSTENLGGAGKPAPDVFLETCRLLGVKPRRTVVVEDSTNGILSARAAGTIVVAVPPAFHPPSAEILAQADIVLATLDDLTVELVESLL